MLPLLPNYFIKSQKKNYCKYERAVLIYVQENLISMFLFRKGMPVMQTLIQVNR